MNGEALEMTALTGLMLACNIAPTCKFDRKNYFYPDMPKNYQITQYELPICVGGGVPLHDLAYPKDAQKNIVTPGKVIRLTRIHLEEDVAKSTHFEQNSGIDFNRAGTPLMEIVSEPEIASPEEAFAYLTALQQILIYAGVSDADMEKGQLRCDCNVSVRPEGDEKLGVKVEIKNMISISGVRRAIAYEIERQTDCAKRGERIVQSTRRWDDNAGQTFLMRVKEDAHDYRYFPDPDLMPVDTTVFIDVVRARKPELPGEKRARFVADYGVTEYDASVLADNRDLANWFELAAKDSPDPKAVCNWVINDLLSALATSGTPLSECRVLPAQLCELVAVLKRGDINGNQAKQVFAAMLETGETPSAIIEARGLRQVSDTGMIEDLCRVAISANPKPVAEYKAGKVQSINFLKGQVIKASGGKANPQVVSEVLARLLA
jgi:aspartyl-tRNA(Asn)/glutamyl-tRNA(Gln) amidotransferase subunit B